MRTVFVLLMTDYQGNAGGVEVYATERVAYFAAASFWHVQEFYKVAPVYSYDELDDEAIEHARAAAAFQKLVALGSYKGAIEYAMRYRTSSGVGGKTNVEVVQRTIHSENQENKEVPST